MGPTKHTGVDWDAFPVGGTVGTIVGGKYRVERILGEGGMGIVVAAVHLGLGERVAIKFPTARMRERADVLPRLAREGRAAMRIRSEHVGRVYDFGALPSGQPFLVMEYLDGKDLRALLSERGRLSIDEAVEYTLQTLEALAEAHARGIIHRDIKPSNLFLTRRGDGSPLVKLIDFGTSKIAEAEMTLTHQGTVVGSLPFMAPEQMRSTREMDARSDIWAVGATLHTLLTGKPPFGDGTMVETYERALAGPPPLTSLCPGAPLQLERILRRAMARDPSDRYRDVGQLAADLAPLAPAHARVSATRAAGILAAGLSRAPEGGDDPANEGAAAWGEDPLTAATEPPAETASATAIERKPVAGAAELPAAAPVVAGGRPRVSRARDARLVVAVAAVALVAIGAVVLSWRHAGRVSAAAPSAAPRPS